MSAQGTVTINAQIPGQPTSGKIVHTSSPLATYVNLGFVPSYFKIWNTTDKDTSLEWTQDMADGTGVTDAGVAVASEGITPMPQTNGTYHGVLVGTDGSCQEASDTFDFIAYR